MDKQIEIKILESLGQLTDKLEKMENKLSILTKTSEYLDKTKQILEKKKVLTKKQVLEELGISGRNWRGWSELTEGLSLDSKINVHKGMGRSETIIVYLNDFGTTISMASRLFKSLNVKKDYNLSNIEQMFDVDSEKANKILSEMDKIFKGRIKVGFGGCFKRTY